MSRLTESQIIDVMNACLNKLQFSTPRYILGSYPYLEANDKEALKAVNAAANEEDKLYLKLMILIEKREGVPQAGLPDPLLADLNYLSYPHLLDVLMRDKERELAKCKKRAAAVDDCAEVHELLKEIAEAHEAHLNKFKDVRAKKYKTDKPAAESA